LDIFDLISHLTCTISLSHCPSQKSLFSP